MDNVTRVAGENLDLSVRELPKIDLSFSELERITTPDIGDWMTGIGAGVALSTAVVGTIALT